MKSICGAIGLCTSLLKLCTAFSSPMAPSEAAVWLAVGLCEFVAVVGLCEFAGLCEFVVMLGLYEWFCTLTLLVAEAGLTDAGPSIREKKRKGRRIRKKNTW